MVIEKIQDMEQEGSEVEVVDEPAKKRKLVVPGEVIISGEDYLPSDGTRREGDNILASRFGLAEEAGMVIKVIPVTGAYIPRRNNVVIGRVTNVTMNGWVIDIDYASNAFLPIDESPRFINKNEMDQFLAIGDVIIAKIWSINSRGVDLSLKSRGLGKLEGGFIFKVQSSRVPRIIGKEGSMIALIKQKTNATVTVGQNGWVWITADTSDDALKARRAVEFIVDNFYQAGLTEKVEEFLSK